MRSRTSRQTDLVSTGSLLLFIEQGTDGYDRGRAVCLGVLKGDSEVLAHCEWSDAPPMRGEEAGQSYFRPRMNWAVETSVKLGQRTGTLVEIKQGLKESQKHLAECG